MKVRPNRGSGRSRTAAARHEAIGDAALGQIVGRQFDQHFVADEHADAVLAHLSGRVTEDFVIILEPDAEHRVGQKLDHLAAHFEELFLGQTKPSEFWDI
ncbi:conserved hypothetical protein [Sphingomonas sp. EC-HK361]|nr:conserved hypothetical protein [Sphingomonas sp. EC-HK361]